MTILKRTNILGGRSVESFTDSELQSLYHQVAQEIDRRGGHVDSYAAPHVWNLTAKILRENFSNERENSTPKIIRNNTIADIALAFAKRFAEDDGFDPISWLDKCSPDPDMYPFSELWDEPDPEDLIHGR